MEVLRRGRILAENEEPREMIERVVNSLLDVESVFGTTREEIALLKKEFGELLDGKYCVMSTPVLTNAGRYLDKPLSACTVPKLDFAHPDLHRIGQVVREIHQEGMGTGFSLNDAADPVGLLGYLNRVANESADSGKEDRPVGNMATLSVYHPRILDFIQAKIPHHKANEGDTAWKFNLSVDCDEHFFECLEQGDKIQLGDGSLVEARDIFESIVQAAHQCADPGLIFLDRMESDNPTPGVGHYVSTAPCAEVGLAEGESCQFGYINLGMFSTGVGQIDIEKLKHVTRLMTRTLDDALEISIHNYSEVASREIMAQKRKIGIGVCGLADLFVRQGMLYGSAEARSLALDLITLINFESKVASHELAIVRGSCEAMDMTVGNKHLATPPFLEEKYGTLSTRYVQPKDWIDLADKIRSTRQLRNVSTIALPPTGRSALVIDASTGIEPIFSYDDQHIPRLLSDRDAEAFLQVATSITPEDHLFMVASLQRGVDESISKTVNLPADATVGVVRKLYLEARRVGLKGISIYRDGSKDFQPKALS